MVWDSSAYTHHFLWHVCMQYNLLPTYYKCYTCIFLLCNSMLVLLKNSYITCCDCIYLPCLAIMHISHYMHIVYTLYVYEMLNCYYWVGPTNATYNTQNTFNNLNINSTSKTLDSWVKSQPSCMGQIWLLSYLYLLSFLVLTYVILLLLFPTPSHQTTIPTVQWCSGQGHLTTDWVQVNLVIHLCVIHLMDCMRAYGLMRAPTLL